MCTDESKTYVTYVDQSGQSLGVRFYNVAKFHERGAPVQRWQSQNLRKGAHEACTACTTETPWQFGMTNIDQQLIDPRCNKPYWDKR